MSKCGVNVKNWDSQVSKTYNTNNTETSFNNFNYLRWNVYSNTAEEST